MVNSDNAATQVGFWETVQRAGFWRRVLALFIDIIVVSLPLQILLIVLFAQTNGAVQGSFGINSTSCVSIGELPTGFEPPPPPGFNSIVECQTSLLGFDTSHSLRVAEVNQDGSVTTSIYRDYTLGADGRPNRAFTTDWIAILLLFAYLIFMDSRLGRTLGKRALNIRTIDIDAQASTGIPLRKAFLRQLAMLIGMIPMIIIASVMFFKYLAGADLTSLTNRSLFSLMIFGGLIEAVWLLWIVISVANKQDPIYDRLAGTAVVRT
jgi:uncharacterized RDD family membrane protein YckC